MEFELKSADCHIKIDLVNKYTYVNGRSASGKSLIIEEINSVSTNIDSEDAYIKCELPVQVVSSNKADDRKYSSGIVYFADEQYAWQTIQDTMGVDCYVVIASRNVHSNLNVALNAVYCIVNDRGTYKAMRRYRTIETEFRQPELVICEDSASGFEFWKKAPCWTRGTLIITSHGKSNLAAEIKKATLNNECKNILVICDAGGLANEATKICKEASKAHKAGVNIQFLIPVCFEHVLMCTELVGHKLDVYGDFDKRDNSIETCCEKYINKITKGKPYEHNHKYGRLSECWTEECIDCKNECRYKVNRPKWISNLENGPAAGLLLGGKNNGYIVTLEDMSKPMRKAGILVE